MKKLLIAIVITFIIVITYIGLSQTKKDNEQSQENYNYNEKNTNIEKLEKSKNENLIILKFAHYLPESHPQHIALSNIFVPLVEEGSNWNIRIELYPNNRLGNELEYINGLENGTLEMCIGSSSLIEKFPKIKIPSYPYLFKDYSQAYRILNGTLGTEIAKDVNIKGMSSIAWTLNGFDQIVILNKPLDNRNSNKLKLATINFNFGVDFLESLGYEVRLVTMNNMTLLLNQGIVDGHDTTPLISYYNGWYENNNKILITKHSTNSDMYLISNKFLETLSSEYEELIRRAAKESAKYEVQLLEEMEDALFDDLKQKGVDIIYPDISKYRQSANEYKLNWLDENNELISLLDKYNKETE